MGAVEGNLRGLQEFAKRIRAGEATVLVGVPVGAPPAEDGTSLAVIAAANEFGVNYALGEGQHGPVRRHIPERSFLRAGIRENMGDFRELNARNLRLVARGSMTEDRALGLLGLKAASAVQEKIIDGPFEPNAPSTIAAKGSSRPLIGKSGQLRQSITWALEEGQSEPVESFEGGGVSE